MKNQKVGFVLSKTATAGSANVNRMIFDALKDEFNISLIYPETLYYQSIPILGILLNYFTLYEKRKDYDTVIATTWAGLPFVENNRLIEIFHGVDTSMIRTANLAVKNKTKVLNKWLKKTEDLFTETLHDLESMDAMNRIAEKHVADRAIHVIAVSEKVKQDLIEILKTDPKKITVIMNGIQDFWFNEMPEDYSDFEVICPTRLDFRVFTFIIKGQDRLLEIMSSLPGIKKLVFSNFSKIIKDDFKEGITKFIESTGAKFSANVRAEELKAQYKPGFVLLSTSRTEACQLTLLEGMASKLIPVTYDVGVAKDVIQHGQNGFIVKSEKEAIKTIKYLAKNPELRKKIAERAYETAKSRFTINKMISQYRSTFKKII